MISPAALDELKARHPCHEIARQWVSLRRGGKLGLRGPCPLHSPKADARDSTSFECNAEKWVCAVCSDGGDVIKLLALRNGLDPRRDFTAVVALLGGAAEPDADRAAALEAARAAKAAKAAREDNQYRAREIAAARAIYDAMAPLAGTPGADYYALRGIMALPDGHPLRYGAGVPFFHGKEENEIGRAAPRMIWRGPAVGAPIVDRAGAFCAVHITWLDLKLPGGKAIINDPDSGERLLSRKVRGSKAGGVIRLAYPPAFTTWCIGEGIETALSVWYALSLAGRDLTRTGFAAAVDLGNLAGRAAKSVPHPALKNDRGAARRVPGPDPDLAAPGLAPPPGVADAVILGDGDSDRFTTQCALCRAQARLERAMEGK